MAATIIRTVLLRSATAGSSHKSAVCCYVQNRSIAGKALRESLPPQPPKPAPFDYVNKDYTWLRSLFDRTTHRLDQNSKVVVVEGPVAVGKTKFAKALAEDLDMQHFPEATLDRVYIQNGVDIRMFDDQVPEDARTFDHRNFNLCPDHRLAANFQIMMYIERFSQYIDALAHLLNTGQGVVLERSPFSDFVFLEAMFAQGWISKGARGVYNELVAYTLDDLLRPHLVIYLDLPVDKVIESVKQRGYEHEVKGKALTPQYLTEVERWYKTKYLRDISTHAELLVYDWTGGGDVEVVVEDIERFDFDKYTEREEPKMKDWRFTLESHWADKRMIYTNQKDQIMNQFGVPLLDVPELLTSAEDLYERNQVVLNHPAFEFEPGYNKGEGNTLFKTKVSKYTTYF